MGAVIIVSGHGHFASGMESAVKMVAGTQDDVYFIDFEVDDSDETLHSKYMEVIGRDMKRPILFICDMLGGTPYKTAASIVNDKENMELVTGCNLLSLIEALLNRDGMALSALAASMVETSLKSTLQFEKVDIANAETTAPDNFDDGI